MASDDSGRFRSKYNGVCCNASDLTSEWEFASPSPLAAGVSLTLTSSPAAFVDPLPGVTSRLPDAYVNCPMPAVAVPTKAQ